MSAYGTDRAPAYARILEALDAHGCRVRELGNGRARSCGPGHGGDNPEGLSIMNTETRVNLTCFTAGCDGADVLAAVGLTVADRYHQPKTRYVYESAGQRTRVVTRDAATKRFSQASINGAPTLYRLDRLAAAEVVWLVEGEEDVHSLEAVGAMATTAPQGATNFASVDATPLHGKQVRVVVDNDAAGERWAASVTHVLAEHAQLQFLKAAAGKDASDHLAAGHGVEDFQPWTPSVSTDLHDQLVRDELRKMRARADAKAMLDAERRGPVPPFDLGTLAEVLARPAPPPARIEGLIPWESSTLITAMRKTGKTTTVLNLARSLLTGQDFLGRFSVRPVDGSIAFLNFEVSGTMLAGWARDVQVPADRLLLVNLRGRRNPLAGDDRERLAGLLRARGVETVIVDPFGRAYTGTSQNDAGEVGAFLADLDRWVRGEVGAVDLVLTAHAGWNGERTRGSSAVEDWADVLVTLTRDEAEGGDGQRYLRAFGRDVLVDEDQLVFDSSTRTLKMAGLGSRVAARYERQHDHLDQAVLDVIASQPGVTGAGIGRALKEAGVGHQRGDEYGSAKRLVAAGRVVTTPGPRGAKCYFEPTYPDVPRPTPAGCVLTYPDPTLIGGVGQEGTSEGDLPRTTCTACGEPMTIIEAGQTTHPGCDPA